MPAKTKSRASANSSELAAILAQRLSESLLRERIIPRFVDSYVIEHGRHSLQVHAGLYRDLLTLLQREALVTLSARTLQVLTGDGAMSANVASREKAPGAKAPAPAKPPMSRKEAAAFRQKFMIAMTRHHRWHAGDSLAFQSDLQMYEDLIARAGSARRPRKPFEAANHPFVDRCAFVLDSSFLEKARLAASRALVDVETLADKTVEEVLQESIRH